MRYSWEYFKGTVMDSDYNTYVSSTVININTTVYPRWMYHPTNPPQVVVDVASQNALIASDSLWSLTDPNLTT